MTQRTASRIVKSYISGWSDQKLAEVLAFAEDGKMDYHNECCCLLGVASSDNLHQSATVCGSFLGTLRNSHYGHEHCRVVAITGGDINQRSKQDWAYSILGIPIWMLVCRGIGPFFGTDESRQKRRDQQLTIIIRSIMAEREEKTAAAENISEKVVAKDSDRVYS